MPKRPQKKLHADFVLVPAHKAATNVFMVHKKYFIETSMKEHGMNTTSNTNSTYTPSADSSEIFLKTHTNVINSVGLEMYEKDKNLPYLQ